MNLADALSDNAFRRPDHPAVIAGDRVLSHGAFFDLVCRWASAVADLGVVAGDIVGVNLKDTAEHLVALYATARCGAAILPMDWRWTEEEKSRVAGFFGAKIVLSEADDPFNRVAGTWRNVVANADWDETVGVADGSRIFPETDDPAFLLALSSGTTGVPKGPLITHRQFFARFMIYFVTLGFNERTRYLCATPLYFGGSRGYAMCSLYAGGTVLLHPPPFEPADLVAFANDRQATMLFLVPTQLRRMMALAGGGDGAPLFRTLECLFSTGAVLHPEERTELMARLCPRYLNFYGSTDGGGCSALMWHDPATVAASVGRPVFGARIDIVGEDHRPLPAGEAGRIRYRHPGTATGYYNDADASREAFRDGWYYPGDLGWLDPDGFLYLAGRATDMIIRGGVNIYPAEIEHVLTLHAAVHEAAVVAWPSREFGEEIAAFVVPREGADGSVIGDDLISHCRQKLARYKVPREVFVVDELPKSGVGKVLKDRLTARLEALV
jgi:acyl-CoA synthetase (AMP-forming)/AMP-acid ligase II